LQHIQLLPDVAFQRSETDVRRAEVPSAALGDNKVTPRRTKLAALGFTKAQVGPNFHPSSACHDAKPGQIDFPRWERIQEHHEEQPTQRSVSKPRCWSSKGGLDHGHGGSIPQP